MPSGVPRTPQPWEWVRKKTCSRCGTAKPWALFSPYRYWPDGSVRQVQAHCRECDSKRRIALNKEWKERNREHVRAYERRYWRQRRAEIRRERVPKLNTLPLEPFRSWLEVKVNEFGIIAVAELSRVSDRSLRRVMTGENQAVALTTVDACLVAFGEHLNDLYPPLEEAA